MAQHCQVIELLANHRYVFRILIFENVLHKIIVCIQNQRCLLYTSDAADEL